MTFDRLNKIFTFTAYLTGYLFMSYIFSDSYDGLHFLIFSAFFTFWILIGNRHFTKESVIWLICLWINIIVLCSRNYLNCFNFLTTGKIWYLSGIPYLTVYGYAIYWIMSHNHGLLKNESSGYFFIDCFRGLILLPFGNFFLLFKNTLNYLKNVVPKEKNDKQILYIVFAAGISLILFFFSVSLLSSFDDHFYSIFQYFLAIFDYSNWDLTVFLFKVFLSLPVSCYLYGLAMGCLNIDVKQMDLKRTDFEEKLKIFQHLPVTFSKIILACFIVLYAVFFITQAQTFYSIFFTKASTEAYLVSQYARNGFFALCKVMVINFLLLLLIEKSSSTPQACKGYLITLIIESIILAVIAFCKIYVYIHLFGFTPLRYQSIWLTSILMFSCICVLYYLIAGRNVSRLWVFVTGITLALTYLY